MSRSRRPLAVWWPERLPTRSPRPRPVRSAARAVALGLGLAALLAPTLGAGCATPVQTPSCETDPTQPGCEGVIDDEDHKPARLYVDPPFGVGFDCVQVGCEETRTFTLENRGDDPVHIVLVRTTVETSTEFSFELLRPQASEDGTLLPIVEPVDNPTIEEPLVIKPGDIVQAVVAYIPDDAQADEGALRIDWYAGNLDYADAVVDEVVLPLTTRVLGEAVAEIGTSELNFGYIPVGQTATLSVEVENATQGNAILAVTPAGLNPGSDTAFRVKAPGTVFVNPGETASIDVEFTPNAFKAFSGALTFTTNDGARPQLTVTLSGTSIEQPYFRLVEPAGWNADFGDVRIGLVRERQVTIQNLGGLPLIVTPHFMSGADQGFSANINFDQPLPAVLPLSSTTFTLTAEPAEGGEHTGEISFETNDPTLPVDWIDMRVYGIAPDAFLSTDVLDFGSIVQSWTSPAQQVVITNVGTGDLSVTGLEWQVGSSSQIHLADQPDLPVKIGADGQLVLSVYVNGQTIGPANGTLLIHTDSVNEPTRSVQVFAQVVTCDEGCAMAGGTPTCASGSCQVGVCYAGLHDADGAWSNGCECGEDTAFGDVGSGCGGNNAGANVGPLGDDGQSDYQNSVTRTGTLHDEDDVDLYWFYAVDGGGLNDTFSDSFGIKVEFIGAVPPGLMFCHRNGNDGCGGLNQRSCGWTSRSFAGGSWGSDDNTYVTVWVEWADGANPVCGNYQIRFRADDG